MKTIKKIILITTLITFAGTFYNFANAATDCSNPKGFHQKMTCKFKGESSSNVKNSQSEEKDTFWNRLKNFGGKNIGSAG